MTTDLSRKVKYQIEILGERTDVAPICVTHAFQKSEHERLLNLQWCLQRGSFDKHILM